MGSAWIGLTAGALAFSHCLGMCGGFALHLSRNEPRPAALARLLLWSLGRTSTYVFLGAMAGFVGETATSRLHLGWLQNGLAYVAGSVMVLMGLTLLGVVPQRWRRRWGTGPESLLLPLLRPLMAIPSTAQSFVLGLATGFLPCPIVLGLLALSVHGRSVAAGMVTMAALGAGTLWSLVLLGLTGNMIQVRFRRWAAPAGATVLVLLGAVTVLRATPALHHLLGHREAQPGSAQQESCHSSHAMPAVMDEGSPATDPSSVLPPGRP